MSSQQLRSNDATASASVASVDMKLEVWSSPSRMSIAQRSSIQGSGGGSTPTAPQVTTGTRTRLHRKSTNAAGQADGSVGTSGIAGPGHWQLCRRIWLRSNYLYESRLENLWNA